MRLTLGSENGRTWTKGLQLNLFVTGFLFVSLCSPARAQELTIGQTETGSINAALQKNIYTFSATAGDIVDFTLAVTGGSLVPAIVLYSPSGTQVASNYAGYPYGCSGSTIEMNTILLSTSGTYTVDVYDCSHSNAGNYALYAQRINTPAGAVPLPFGHTEAGTISLAAQSNTYTFNANANTVIDFTLTTTSGSLVPKIRLYSSAGTEIASNESGYPYGCSGSTLEMNGVSIPANRVYTVLIGDCGDESTGSYELYAETTDNPPGSVALLLGQTQTGTVALPAQSVAYTFSANVNDVIDFTVVTTAGNIVPKIRLYNPNGSLVAGTAAGVPYGCNGSTVELNTVSLSSAGVYTVLIGDCGDASTGSYAIYSQRTNNPTRPSNLPFNQTQNGLVSSAAQSYSYTFSANANDVVDFTLATTSGSLVPKIRLYNPNGSELTGAAAGVPYGCNGSTVELNTVKLAIAGVYTVLIGDCGDTSTGNFDLYAQRTNNPTGAVPVVWNQTQNGTIGSAAQSGSYTFSGSTNNVVDFTVVRTSGVLVPKIRLYNPDGSELTGAAAGVPYGCSGSIIGLNSITLPQNGVYSVLLGDCSDTSTGSYSLSSQCFGTCPVTPSITWPTPAAIVYGTPLSGTQLDAAATVGGTPLAGTLVYSPVAGTIPRAGVQTLSVTFTPTDNKDYTAATATVQLMVNKAVPAITWTTPAAIAYGTALSATQLDAHAAIAGTFVYSPAIGTVPTAGAHTLSVTFTPTDTTDYTTATATVQLTVTSVPTVIAWAAPAAITYGTALGSAQLDASATAGGKAVAGMYVYSPTTGTVLNPGSHTLSVTFTPTDTTDYAGASATVSLLVNKAVLTVTANNVSRAYAQANPAFTSTITGFVNGDKQSVASGTPSLTTTATASSMVGAYPLAATTGSLAAANYTFKFVNGTLTVTQAAPAITWPTPTPVTYGTALSTVQLDASSAVLGTFVYSPSAGVLLTAGVHTLTVAFTPADTKDYATVKATVQFTVNKATSVVTWAKSAAITYGTPLGATQLDASSKEPGTFVYSPAAGAVLAAGANTLSATFTPTDTTDYTPATATTQLMVNKVLLTVTANNVSVAYSQPLPQFTYSVTGFVNGDTSKVLSGAPTETSPAKQGSSPGTYPITITPGSLIAANYSFQFNNGTLTITAVPVPVVTLSTTNVAFGDQTINTATLKTVTLTNSGSAALSISNIAVTGVNLSAFFINDSCGSSVAAGASCGISILFYPVAKGADAAAVTIVDNASGSPQNIMLTGTGQ